MWREQWGRGARLGGSQSAQGGGGGCDGRSARQRPTGLSIGEAGSRFCLRAFAEGSRLWQAPDPSSLLLYHPQRLLLANPPPSRMLASPTCYLLCILEQPAAAVTACDHMQKKTTCPMYGTR